MEQVRSLYKSEIDFAALALQSRDFAKHLRFDDQLDFHDEAAVRQLTISLLEHDFSLRVDLPKNRLCPPVPNRLNYIIWIQDLLDTSTAGVRDGYDPDRGVVGLDVGTGCCSIYPLLGCKVRPRWRFIATDIDEQNLQTARANVSRNGLDSRIKIIKSTADAPLFALDTFEQDTLDFTMCNPPFYASEQDMLSSAESKSYVPFSACTGAAVEMIVAGGEVAFVTRMIEESRQLRHRVQWYSSMLGKLSSVTTLVELLIKYDNNNYAVTEFVQGSKTKRWALAWSWEDRRPSMAVARNIPGFPKHLLPFPADFTFTLSANTNIDGAISRMNAEFASLPWHWTWHKDLSAGVGFAPENVWSRQARRKMKLLAGQAQSGTLLAVPKVIALGVRVQLRLLPGEDRESKEVQATIRWIQGTDSVIFESFCGMAKRKIEGR
ncbi:RNA N6-adenosine-methyltransferase METTL16 [Penicillium oxalicum]|uniref:RNA N6-adenosine-methyltransferase METTL16 n=1 Tax=Penicillium oxalicum TaxID=69781 RepID=UPI0020B7C9A1|nr:RNA N6-adenosine-methyltransferase METTL16 [Penicillium oxalicum]KAI2794133.1 RNA N6-adenosine-methyltransferase METTL16 [Penicillium oxalicum]